MDEKLPRIPTEHNKYHGYTVRGYTQLSQLSQNSICRSKRHFCSVGATRPFFRSPLARKICKATKTPEK